jgi:uncharacterized membrane protein YfcA
MLSATLLFVFGGKLTRTPPSSVNRNLRAHDPSFQALIAACFFQFLVAIYGGYFGGGMGFVILAMLTAFGMADIHEMNALKIVLSSATNGVAVVVFMTTCGVLAASPDHDLRDGTGRLFRRALFFACREPGRGS